VSAADDLKALLDSSGVDLSRLSDSFPLADFDYMFTAQRTMAKVYEKLQQVGSAVPDHQNFWPDLRRIGLAEDETLTELGQQALSHFATAAGETERLYFVLKNLRSNEKAPAPARDEYREKVHNLKRFIARLPEDGSGRQLLSQARKLRFLEVLNAFPHVVERFLELPTERREAVVGLKDDELKGLFLDAKDSDYAKVASRLANRDRFEEATVHFIETEILLEYEDAVVGSPEGWIPLSVFPEFSKIIDAGRLETILGRSTDVHVLDVEPPRVADELRKANIVMDEATVVDFFLSVMTRPLLILTGVSGTGKTKLAQIVAKVFATPRKIVSRRASPPTPESLSERSVVFVPVRPDWTDNRQVLGFHNILTHTFHATPILEALARAIDDPGQAYFVILDEMNLARVEHYFSDLLSCLESRYFVGGRIIQEPLLLHAAGSILPSQPVADSDDELRTAYEELARSGRRVKRTSRGNLIAVPERLHIGLNCFFVGTVNVDETTYMFSPKVLDRAHVIEVRPPPVAEYLEGSSPSKTLGALDKIPLTAEEFSTAGTFPHITLADALSLVSGQSAAESFDFSLTLQQLHEILRLWRYEFGPRVMRDFLVYAAHAVKVSRKCTELNEADRTRLFGLLRIFDACLFQKALPKIHGSRRVIEDLLQALLSFCASDYDAGAHKQVLGTRGSPRGRELARADFSTDVYRFPRSAEKIHDMLRQLEAMNFASFIR
jgi:hypothetical protein